MLGLVTEAIRTDGLALAKAVVENHHGVLAGVTESVLKLARPLMYNTQFTVGYDRPMLTKEWISESNEHPILAMTWYCLHVNRNISMCWPNLARVATGMCSTNSVPPRYPSRFLIH
jgi:hypothetical protein